MNATDAKPPIITAVILAAGVGTRLAPLTDTTPKPLLQVGSQPVVSHLLDRLNELTGLSHVVVMVNDQHPRQWADWKARLNNQARVTILSNGIRTEADRPGAVADLATALPRCQRQTILSCSLATT